MIEVRHLRKEYQKVIPLTDVNTSISKGEVISVIGPSGTGKSTFLRCLNGLEKPSSGEIFLEGVNIYQDPATITKVRQKMGMVFQSFNLFNNLTVLENCIVGQVKVLGRSKEEARDRALEYLSKVGMSAFIKARPQQISGGQKQRVAIARALAMDPDILLFDEPTSALDPETVGEVLSVMQTLAEEGMTMLVVTHELAFTQDISSQVFFMHEGKIHERGTPAELFGNPDKAETRDFLSRFRRDRQLAG